MTHLFFDGNDIRVLIGKEFASQHSVVTFSARSRVSPAPVFGDRYFEKIGISAIHVQSKRNHWWHTREIDRIGEAIRAVGFQDYHLYGSSMGGYAALMLPQQLGAAGAVSLSPQTYILSENGGFDRRWDPDRRTFSQAFDERRRLRDQANRKLWVFMDCKNSMERPHMDILRDVREECGAPDWHLIDVPYGHHPVTPAIQKARILDAVLKHVFTDAPLSLDQVAEDCRSAYRSHPKSFMNFLRSAKLADPGEFHEDAVRLYEQGPDGDIEFQFFSAEYFVRAGDKARALAASRKTLVGTAIKPYILEKHANVLSFAEGPAAAADFLAQWGKAAVSTQPERLTRNTLATAGRHGETDVLDMCEKGRPMGATTPGEKDKVLIGRDGWLFLRNDTNRTMEQISGQYRLEPEFEWNWVNLFRFRKGMLARLGCSYIFSIAPAKECLYADKLPADIAFSSVRPVHKVLSAAKGLVNTFYSLDLLLAARQQGLEPYPQGDTHWDFVGAYLAYEGLMKQLGLTVLDRDRCQTQVIDYECDLSVKLGYNGPFTKGVIERPGARRIFDNRVKNVGGKIIYENSNKSLPSCVIFRDSFAILQLPLLAESFSRVTAVWQPNIDYGILSAERPDVVISQQAERFLVACPDDVNGRSNEEYVRQKTVPA
jgi:pimeloyl-ACP methyl ester carboxylesterase